MPSKNFILDGGLSITIYKRRTNRNLRLSIAPTGQIRVTIPAWAPYSAGLNFAKSRRAWILEQHSPLKPLVDGQAIGKAHHLHFLPKAGAVKSSSRVGTTTVTVNYPATLSLAGDDVQQVARDACVRALRSQAEQLLPQRLAALAQAHGFSYAGVSVKRLKSRWGSCDQETNIVLNLFLMQLPWDLIDYVLLHELTHTKVLRHGPDFWKAMNEVSPKITGRKKLLKTYQPVLNSIG